MATTPTPLPTRISITRSSARDAGPSDPAPPAMTMVAVTGAIFNQGRPVPRKARTAVDTAMLRARLSIPGGRTKAKAAPASAPVTVPMARSRAMATTPPPTLACTTTMAEITLQ